MQKKIMLYVIMTFLIFNKCKTSVIVKSDKNLSNKSFVFSIKNYSFSQGNMLIGANENIDEEQYKKFALSLGFSKSKEFNDQLFIPVAPKKVNLNYKNDINNPFYGKKINQLTLVGNLMPALVVDDDDTTVYIANNILDFENYSVISPTDASNTTTFINDADGKSNNGIVGLVSSGDFLLAAVKKNKGEFGDLDGSGVALLKYYKKTIQKGEKNKKEIKQFLEVLDAVTGTAGNRALALDRSSDVVKISGNLTNLSFGDIYWDRYFKTAYIGLKTKSASGPGDGSKAVVMANIKIKNENNQTTSKLKFKEIAPDNVFEGEGKIIGSIGPDKQVDVYKIRTMTTSTGLRYLIIIGGEGDKVFALPLVDLFNRNKDNGKLAKKNSIISEYQPERGELQRGFSEKAENSEDMFTETSEEALIGGGTLPNKIINIFVSTDTIFAAVGSEGINEKPGIFYSQAILEYDGRIKGWTQWQRAVGTNDNCFGIIFDSSVGRYWYLTGENENNIDTVKRTQWGKGLRDGLLGGPKDNPELGLTSIVEEEFPVGISGIQGLFDFSKDTLVLGNETSMLIVSSLNKIMLVETGRVIDNIFTANTGDFLTHSFNSQDGSLSDWNYEEKRKVVIVSGGDLAEIGPIEAVELASDEQNNGWIFAGGTDGLVVLAQDNGNGFNPALGPGFAQFNNQLKFRKIASFGFIRKIVSDNKYLYILTDTSLKKIKLDPDNFDINKSLEVYTLADSNDLNRSSFSDIIISEKLALLATSKGLYRTGNGKDIGSAENSEQVGWTFVEVPNSLGPISRLFSLSTTNKEQDIFRGGEVYVLSSYVGYNQARINRFSIKNISFSEIDDDTIQHLPDKKNINGEPAFYANFGSYVNYFSTDGTLSFYSRSKYLDNPISLKFLPHQIVLGRINFTRSNKQIFLNELDISNNSSTIGKIIKNSALGSILAPGEFGLRISE